MLEDWTLDVPASPHAGPTERVADRGKLSESGTAGASWEPARR